MGSIHIGINLEFVRHNDKPFEWGVEKAAELGYEYVEPMVHWGRELLSEAGYFHSVSMLDDPYRVKRACEKAGVKLSGLSTHTPLGKPEIGTEYLKQAIRFAAECGAPVVNTDEGPKSSWTTEEEDFVLMRYTLMEAARVAEPRGIKIGLEPHQQYSRYPQGLDRIYRLVNSPAIGINFDTGNTYLCGQDSYAWLESIVDRLVHLHAKDISVEHSAKERGKVTGTPVGCACGDGVIDWRRVIALCRRAIASKFAQFFSRIARWLGKNQPSEGRKPSETSEFRCDCPALCRRASHDIVLSVECGTVDQAERSLRHLQACLG